MTGFSGPGIPAIIGRAIALTDKLVAYRDKMRLKGTERELVSETLEVIGGLRDHAKAEYERGRKTGKEAVLRKIRDRFDPDLPDLPRSEEHHPWERAE